MSVRKSREKLQTNVWKIYSKPLKKFKHTGTPQKIFKYNPLFCSFSLQVIFFSEQPFYGNYSTIDSHINSVISNTFAYSLRWRRKPWKGLFGTAQPSFSPSPAGSFRLWSDFGHSFHLKWVNCAKDFRKIEGQQIRQVVSLTERCIIEGWETKIWSTYLLSIKSYSLLFHIM